MNTNKKLVCRCPLSKKKKKQGNCNGTTIGIDPLENSTIITRYGMMIEVFFVYSKERRSEKDACRVPMSDEVRYQDLHCIAISLHCTALIHERIVLKSQISVMQLLLHSRYLTAVVSTTTW